MADERPQSGPVPQTFVPAQPSGPMHLQPWGGYVSPHPAPPPEKKQALDIATKLITVALTIGGIVFSAGVLSEKLKHIEENQKAGDARHVQRTQRDDERYDRLKDSFDGLAKTVQALTDQVKEQGRARAHRRRETSGGIDTAP